MRNRLLVLVAALSLVSGCSMVIDDGQVSFVDSQAQLLCDEFAPIALAAQAVPTASHIPCVDTMPAGWRLQGTDYGNDGLTVYFESSRAPIDDLTLEYSSSCSAVTDPIDLDSTGLRLPPDATASFDLVSDGQAPTVRLVAETTGGCLELTIDLEADEAVTFEDFPSLQWVPRPEIDSWVREETSGRERLDP